MKHYSLLLTTLLLAFASCQPTTTAEDTEEWKAEIMAVEKAFNDMAQEEGLAKAFEFYAAENGAIRRGKKVIKGKKEIGTWYENDSQPNETLTWEPTFVDVSSSGDMAYTYGDYVFTYFDTEGLKKENKGIFHTVWKRQADGSWRFVWD
ncbi:DUF4440 domain-containing protein [Ekhidna sp.]|uniref:YybH family protein n=1 Tax=Ekhidna sp. TaxID=2608089 RepID=UPI0032976FB3